MKIVTVIGARPQIIKASALSRKIQNKFSDKIEEIIVHTGQHYDENMSQVFFSELQIPKEKYNLGVGSLSHGKQTAKMIEGIEDILQKEQPVALVIYGDTNSTLAGAIAASKIHIPVVHIEAGLRSFDKRMPEEINRITADNVSTLLFCPTKAGYDNLMHEGFAETITNRPDFNNPNVYLCGDIMLDNTLYFSKQTYQQSTPYNKTNDNYILCTIHRNSNTDDKQRLSNIFTSIVEIAKYKKIILPLHPRTKKMMPQMLSANLLKQINENPNIQIIPPASYLEMICLENNSQMIITDSGGVQKEAYFLQKPCIILRPQTEWVEIVEHKMAITADADINKITDAFTQFLNMPKKNTEEFCKQRETLFGNGNTSEFICQTIIETLG